MGLLLGFQVQEAKPNELVESVLREFVPSLFLNLRLRHFYLVFRRMLVPKGGIPALR
jgi:hypothetical protein